MTKDEWNPEIVLAGRARVDYSPAMSQTLENRVEELEKSLVDLKAKLDSAARQKPWERTFGTFANDPDFEEAVRRGREYREQQTYQKEIAGS